MGAAPISAAHWAALRLLQERARELGIEWGITGSLGLALQGIEVAVRDIDVRTDRRGAYELERAFSGAIARPISFTAAASVRSHFGALLIEGVTVEIMGDMQVRLADGVWEDVAEWRRHTRRAEIDGAPIPVISLAYERDMYAYLGRADKVEIVRRALER